MPHLFLYIACILGAVGVYTILARQETNLKIIGALVGLAAFVGLLASAFLTIDREAAGIGGGGDVGGTGGGPRILFYVFALISVASAVRMITHSRPVYSALYFVMVVLASASIFLLLEAEFMAFALIIVYAGAILITYLFVLMLAQQAPNEGEAESTPLYDREAREPMAAVTVGFLMLALLGGVVTNQANHAPAMQSGENIDFGVEDINRLPKKQQQLVELFRDEVDDTLPADSSVARITEDSIVFEMPPSGREREYSFDDAGIDPDDVRDLLTQNIERVGMALVEKFPVSLELAGIILLMAMFGAVVLARKQIELGEDEQREAAGLPPIHPENESGRDREGGLPSN